MGLKETSKIATEGQRPHSGRTDLHNLVWQGRERPGKGEEALISLRDGGGNTGDGVGITNTGNHH